MKKVLFTSLMAVGAALTGCDTMKPSVDTHFDQNAAEITARKNVAARNEITDRSPTVLRSSGSWLGMKSTPLQSDDTLPRMFREPYAYRFPGKANIATIAERITKVTGIPVSVKPDVYLPIGQFVKAGGSGASSSPTSTSTAASSSTPPIPIGANGVLAPPLLGAGNNGIPLPIVAGGLGSTVMSTLTQNAPTEFEMNYEGTLDGYLNLLSAKAGISWEYREGVISLHRLVTKVFVLKANPGSQSFNTSLGKSGNTQSTSAGSTTGFNASSTTGSETSTNVWTSIDKQISQMLSPSGKRAISEASSSIVVTDTKDIVDEIGRLIDRENTTLTRQIAMKVEVLSVKLNDTNEFGVDWTSVFSQLSNNFSLRFASPTTLTTQAAGLAGFAVIAPSAAGIGSETQRRFGGTQALIAALAGHGKVSVIKTATTVTLNRKVAAVDVTSTQSYLAEVTPSMGGGAGGGSGGSPGLKLGSVTTGFVMNLLPTVYDSNSILLSMSLGLSDLTRITKVSSGVGANMQSLEAPETTESNFTPSVAMRPGETLILSGYDSVFQQYDRRTLGNNVPIGAGGSFVGTKLHETIIILITPVLVPSAV